jgi:anti-anti-sigma factor
VKPPPPFEIDAVAVPETPGAALLVLSGEFDLAAASLFRERVIAAGNREGVRTVVLDLAEVAFMDSSMLKELLRAHAEMPGRLVLAGLQPAVARLLELTRTAAFFRIAPDRASGLASTLE